jgi:hypothetical protein
VEENFVAADEGIVRRHPREEERAERRIARAHAGARDSDVEN